VRALAALDGGVSARRVAAASVEVVHSSDDVLVRRGFGSRSSFRASLRSLVVAVAAGGILTSTAGPGASTARTSGGAPSNARQAVGRGDSRAPGRANIPKSTKVRRPGKVQTARGDSRRKE
jgi:hypothetical protein